MARAARQLLLLYAALGLSGCLGLGARRPDHVPDWAWRMSCDEAAREMDQVQSVRVEMGRGAAYTSRDVVDRHMRARRAARREADLYNAREAKGCQR